MSRVIAIVVCPSISLTTLGWIRLLSAMARSFPHYRPTITRLLAHPWQVIGLLLAVCWPTTNWLPTGCARLLVRAMLRCRCSEAPDIRRGRHANGDEGERGPGRAARGSQRAPDPRVDPRRPRRLEAARHQGRQHVANRHRRPRRGAGRRYAGPRVAGPPPSRAGECTWRAPLAR